MITIWADFSHCFVVLIMNDLYYQTLNVYHLSGVYLTFATSLCYTNLGLSYKLGHVNLDCMILKFAEHSCCWCCTATCLLDSASWWTKAEDDRIICWRSCTNRQFTVLIPLAVDGHFLIKYIPYRQLNADIPVFCEAWYASVKLGEQTKMHH